MVALDSPKATADAAADTELAAVLAAWPDLPTAAKAAVLAVVRSHVEDGRP